jgi:hypothetical protein
VSTLSTYDGGDPLAQDVATELSMARTVLDETSHADIHDGSDMIRSAVVLRIRLRNLVSAVDAERGEGQ